MLDITLLTAEGTARLIQPYSPQLWNLARRAAEAARNRPKLSDREITEWARKLAAQVSDLND